MKNILSKLVATMALALLLFVGQATAGLSEISSEMFDRMRMYHDYFE